jgi:hypothetical protein
MMKVHSPASGGGMQFFHCRLSLRVGGFTKNTQTNMQLINTGISSELPGEI